MILIRARLNVTYYVVERFLYPSRAPYVYITPPTRPAWLIGRNFFPLNGRLEANKKEKGKKISKSGFRLAEDWPAHGPKSEVVALFYRSDRYTLHPQRGHDRPSSAKERPPRLLLACVFRTLYVQDMQQRLLFYLHRSLVPLQGPCPIIVDNDIPNLHLLPNALLAVVSPNRRAATYSPPPGRQVIKPGRPYYYAFAPLLLA